MKYTFGNTPTTKGEMVKIMKRYGMRKGETHDGRLVSLEHLRYEEICKLFEDFTESLFFKEYIDGVTPKLYGTGDALRFTVEV